MRTDPLSRAMHRVRGFKTWQTVGICDTVNNTGWKMIGALGAAAPTLPSSPATLAVVSNNAGDTAVCQVVYLDADLHERVATFVLNGTSTVSTDITAATISALRVKQVRCRSTNAGIITASIGGVAMMGVAASAKLSRTAILVAPAGQRTWVHSVKFWAQTSKPTQLRVRASVPGETGWVELFRWPARETSLVDAYAIPRVLEDVAANGQWLEAGITLVAEALGGDATSSTVTIMFECEAERGTDLDAAGYRN